MRASMTIRSALISALGGPRHDPSTAYGLKAAVWDSQMNTTQTQRLLKAAGVDVLRYLGGSRSTGSSAPPANCLALQRPARSP